MHTAYGIKGLGDLKSKRIGIPDHCMTAALWFKVTLKDLYGIEAGDNTSYNNRTKARNQGTTRSSGAMSLIRMGKPVFLS